MKKCKKKKFIKKETGSVTLFVLIAMIFFLIVCFFIYTNSNNRKSNQTIELEQLKKNYELTNDELESEYSDIIGDDVTNIDLTTFVTGEDVSHTHIYEKKYDNTYHWDECFICGDLKNKQEHHKATSGTGSCRTYLIDYCTDGCGYSVSTYIDHEIEYYDKDYIYNPSGSNINVNTRECTHGIGQCKKCGERYVSVDGEYLTRQDCVDEDGNPISCINRKKCVYCGYDYSKSTIYHHHQTVEDDGITYRCDFCNIETYRVYHYDKIQDKNNNLHWTIMGIFELLGSNQWTTKENLATWSPVLSSGAFENLEKANVTDLPQEYYNNPTYGTEGITSGLYLVQFEAYIKNGYQGTMNVQLNADNGINYLNGNKNEYARTVNPIIGITISPDTTAPTIDDIQINKSEIVNGFSKKATVTVNCSDSYSDIVYIGLYDTDGNAIVDYGTATSNGDKTFTRTLDIVSETKDSQTLVLKAKDRYGNETTKNIELQNLDAKAPTLINTEDYTKEWSKNKRIELKALDLGVGGVQIAFNNINDYQLAEKNGNTYTRIYNFYGDIYDKVTAAIYLKDALGNEQMVKLDIGKLDNTAPTITKTEISGNIVKIQANDRHEILGEGSGVKGYRYLTSLDNIDKKIIAGEGTFTDSNEIDITGVNGKYLFVAPVDNVGNIGETVKITL